MLTSLRIQNFRSIRDASVKLGQVSLFIGPNNSGKSNFLKGIEFVTHQVSVLPHDQEISAVWHKINASRTLRPQGFERNDIHFQLVNQIGDETFCEINYIAHQTFFDNDQSSNINVFFVNTDLGTREELSTSRINANFPALPKSLHLTRNLVENCIIYKVEPATFEHSAPLSNQTLLRASGSNIANFLNTLSQNHEELFSQLKKDFASCIGNLISISTPPDPDIQGNLKIKFFDNQRNSYWSEEVSEGVLYFLALLCIVHQPDPPKLLLLEEPEKGIHPRRIKEVMDFIFELARMRDIQIILTSHSPYVVDYFADIPECISVFDREDGETVIRNAGDIINETNDKLKSVGGKPIRYTDSLGEHWVSGFLGGVPL